MNQPQKEQECPECGKKVKNLGSHTYQAHRKERVVIKEPGDYIPEKPLRELLSEVRQILNRYQNRITVTTTEQGGKTESVEILARIQT